MGWQIGYDENWDRFIGYGVIAHCDQPGCNKVIDRGLAYVCGGAPYGGEHGCGLYFCYEHLFLSKNEPQLCAKCAEHKNPFHPKPEHPRWIRHILKHKSWVAWREKYPKKVKTLVAELKKMEGKK